MRQLFGYIYDWYSPRDGERPFVETILAARVPELKECHDSVVPGAERWGVLWFHSRRPLLGEEIGDFDPDPNFRYRIHIRANLVTGSVILASQRYTITEAAVECINRALTPDLRRRVINITEVVQHLFKREAQKYAITYLMADVPGHRPFVSTIAIHGEDIGASNFLISDRETFTARQIGVRSVRSKFECGRFGNSGSIQFNLETSAALEQFLSYTYRNKFYIA